MKQEVPSDNMTHDLSDLGSNCLCDATIDWAASTVYHHDLRAINSYAEELLKEAEAIKEKESALL